MRALLPAALSLLAFPTQAQGDVPEPASSEPRLLADEVATAGRIAGLDFSESELELMLPDVAEALEGYEAAWGFALPNSTPPAVVFAPRGLLEADPAPPTAGQDVGALVLPDVQRPTDFAALAFADIPTLAALIRARRVTCVELAELSLARLEALNPELQFTITLTRDRALARARELDAELADGRWRGPLHGIPWGAKDLLAVRGFPTTWGAQPYRDQVLDVDAAVVERLDAAGAVLVAKLSLGALAWGDVWFGGTTKNPWKPEQGSSGSSAGPASAVAAGAVVFAIGSETLGSIISPSERCGTSALRPSFGRVSRHGAMALSWSMDKLGPMTRSLFDAALVFDAIDGPDRRDPAAVADVPFRPVPAPDVEGWRVGYPAGDFEDVRHQRVLDDLRALGVELVAADFPSEAPIGSMLAILWTEAATAFDELTRSGRDDELVRQERRAWPNVFRAGRLVPAVEYLRANRLRHDLVREVEAFLEPFDAYVHPSFAAGVLSATNLTGHPTAVAPCGFREDGTPIGISFTARLDGEERLLALADAWQRSTDHHRKHPELE